MPVDPSVNALLLRHIALLQAGLDACRADSTALVVAHAELAQATKRLHELQASLDEMALAHDEGWASAARRTQDLRLLRDQRTGQQTIAEAARAAESARYEASLSWRVTAPLRATRRLLGRIRIRLLAPDRPRP